MTFRQILTRLGFYSDPRIHDAKEAFVKKYPDRQPNGSMTKIKTIDDVRAVVTVCWGSTRPPSRSWWLSDKGEFSELSIDEAEKLITIPVWL